MLLTLALLAQAAAATAAPTAASDARCVAAFSLLADDKDKETADAGIKGVLYFTGKLLGRDPAVDLGAALKAGTDGIAADVAAETIRCSGELEAMGDALEAAGKALG